MKLYFTTKQLPGMESLPLQERLSSVAKANQKLTRPEKLLLNIIKLIILIPIFVLLTGQFDNWIMLVGIMLCIFAYPAVFKPIHLTICSKYLPHHSKE